MSLHPHLEFGAWAMRPWDLNGAEDLVIPTGAELKLAAKTRLSVFIYIEELPARPRYTLTGVEERQTVITSENVGV